MKRVIRSDTQYRVTGPDRRITNLDNRIRDLENFINNARYQDIDPEDLIDAQIELDELKEQLNFAWQDDEAEYNYAVNQQEFNTDGSLKYY